MLTVIKRNISILFCLSLLIISCNNKPDYQLSSQINPSGICPLCASIVIESAEPVSDIKYTVRGAHSVSQSFESLSNNTIPVIGLYPDKLNNVVVEFTIGDSKLVDSVSIQTPALPEAMPTIEINKIERDKMAKGFHACDLHLAQKGRYHSTPMIFDDEGVVRWYLDFSFNQRMLGPFQKMKSGNIVVIGRHVYYEFDMLGHVLKKLDTSQDVGMHHDVCEISDSLLLIPIGKRDAKIFKDNNWIRSDSDWLILFDKYNNRIVKEWDLAEHLDVTRDDLIMSPSEWLHMNGVVFDKSDSTIIISNRCQGVVKLGFDNSLKWILAPHKDWGNSGREGKGKATAPYLLTAVNASGQAYDKEIQMGYRSADDFDFPWSQHSPSLLPNGNILLFDNGYLRNFGKDSNYSRAVEYSIDEETHQVKQVWEYGKERGVNFYSYIISDADYLASVDNVLITSGFIQIDGQNSCKIVEVDKTSKEDVFEATITYKNLNGSMTPGWGNRDIIYRSERMDFKY